jgi:hypothetical protein
MVLAMLAPRPVMLIVGETDAWSDPYGEFLAARLATPVYRLFDKEGVDGIPQIDVATRHDLVFMMHSAGHGSAPQDTPAVLRFWTGTGRRQLNTVNRLGQPPCRNRQPCGL